MQYVLPTDRKVITAFNRDVVMLHTERLSVMIRESFSKSRRIHPTRSWILILIFVLERVSDFIGSFSIASGERYSTFR